MKSILLPVSGSSSEDHAMSLANTIAEKFNSHIHGLYVRPLPPIVAGEGITVPGDYVARIAEEGKEAGIRARERFTQSMAAAGVTVSSNDADASVSVGQPSASWSEIDGVESHMIGEIGRVHDLILLDRRGGTASIDWKAAAEATLFESGRPLLLAGHESQPTIASSVLIAWNGSTETARVVSMAREIIRRAVSVEVLCVEQGMVSGPDGQHLCDYLHRNGIDASLCNKSSGSIGIGETILERANELGADLILKGAFTHSRLRQMIFGGATSHIMDTSRLPVLLAH